MKKCFKWKKKVNVVSHRYIEKNHKQRDLNADVIKQRENAEEKKKRMKYLHLFLMHRCCSKKEKAL